MVYVSPYGCPRCMTELLRSRIIQIGEVVYREYYCINCGYTHKKEAEGYGNKTQNRKEMSSMSNSIVS